VAQNPLDHLGLLPLAEREHYGIEVPESAVRNITLLHAERKHTQQENIIEPLETKGCSITIAETDGSMLPITTMARAAAV
jgi:hypothetical protein